VRVGAVLWLSTIGLAAACGDPDLATSAPFATDTMPGVVDTPKTEPADVTISSSVVGDVQTAPTTAAWLGTEPPGTVIDTTAKRPDVGPCVDASMQLAPPLPSDEWQRFVLEAAPTGACGVSTVLMMSLVIPGTIDAPGTLVTIVTMPSELSTAQPGTPIDIDGRPATLQQSDRPDGPPATTIIAQFGSIVVNAHGFVDEDTVREIVASIVPLDDTAWAELVASVERG
jgi:hypothetical protein